MPHILILTEENDYTANHVRCLLREREAEVAVFDPGRFPSTAALTFHLKPEVPPRLALVLDGEGIALDHLTSVWFRRPNTPYPNPAIRDPDTRSAVQATCTSFSGEVWDNLPGLSVPAPSAITRMAARRITQLVKAQQVGFDVPETLISTDPDDMVDLYNRHEGRLVTKVLAQIRAFHGDGGFGRYTQPVSNRDIAFVETLRSCPVIVQPYIPKAFELRVTVVGRRLFAAEIHAQQSNRARVDWRRYDLRTIAYREHELPNDVASRCLDLVERLGLCYGAIDMIVTPEGKYTFLEINPSGQYMWIEEAIGLPISEALCDLLLEGNPGAKGE